ncbi:MAG: hypothetical protein WDA27_13025 [Actinomycetota bacterium]
MATAMALGGFFAMIVVALQFSNWAERWLASGASPVKTRVSDAKTTPSRELFAFAREHKTVRAAYVAPIVGGPSCQTRR